MKHQSEILIIGGGVVGISSAYYLTEQGRQVTVVEKGEVCSGSSYGNAGLLVPSHSVPLAAPGVIQKGLRWMMNPESPFYIKPRLDRELLKWLWKFRGACNERHVRKSMPILRDLALASLQLFEELATLDDLEFGFEKRGLLMIFKTEKGLKGGVEEAHLMEEVGIQTQVLSPTDIHQLEPNVRANVVGGVFYPQDAHLIPARFVGQLAQHIEKKGADIRPGTEVLGFETLGNQVKTVRTTRGDFVASEVVLAGGSWSAGIAQDLQLELPIQPAKGYSITVKRPEKCPVIPLSLAEAKVAVTPMGETLRFAGTLELAGLDLSINRRRVRAIENAVSDYLPDIDVEHLELIEIWRGLRPCTPDGLPFLGRSSRYDNLTIATGHAMIGVSLGPITGQLVSQLVMHEKPGIDLSALNPERFS
ncbi:MAG: FAD-dependent oxidoreductase [Candidatus Poribacteria bacterium]|nr:FAD-dependent oxidoreductase [Candidatus Poribacteria bacterium]